MNELRKFLSIAFFAAIALGFGNKAFAGATDLIISEYCEGGGNNKYLEIYNGTCSTVDLSDYRIWKISNNGSWYENELEISGTLEDGEVFVIANPSAATEILDLADVEWSQANWNGNDALALVKDIDGYWTRIDQIGYSDPDNSPSNFNVAGVSGGCANHTLVRKADVTGGTTDWNASAGTNADNSQWIVYDQDTFDDLGSHDMNTSCGSTRITILDKDFEDGVFDPWITRSVLGSKDWYISSWSGRTYARANGYQQDTEDWLISPPMNFQNYTDEILTFETETRYSGPDLEVLISTDYEGEADPNDATWTELSCTLAPDGSSYQWTASGDVDLSGYDGSAVRIAFKYTSTTSSAQLWDVDEILITGVADPNNLLPTVTTANITDISQDMATGGGEVTDEGSSAVTERGVCLSTRPNPTLNDDYSVDGSGEGEFTSYLIALDTYTTYYVRAYATNSQGTAYGSQKEFTTLPWSLDDSDYAFEEWGAAEFDGTYPESMVFKTTPLGYDYRDPGLDAELPDNYDRGYNETGGSRINGLGEDGISFANTSSSSYKYLGAAVLALNTENRTNIEVDWTAGTIWFNPDSDREYGIRMQYRVGSTGDYIDVVDEDGNPIEYLFEVGNTSEGDEESFSAMLPLEAENKPAVEIRWKYYFKDAQWGGSRPELRLDDIFVTSESAVGTPTRLAITKVKPGNPLARVPFELIVRSLDDAGTPKYVDEDTDVQITLREGAGNLGGTLVGTIPAGSNYVIFDDMTYSRAEEIMLAAEVLDGQNLRSGVKRVTVIARPTLVFDIYPKGHVGAQFPAFKVQAIDPDGEVEINYHNYDVTISMISGPDAISGTMTDNTFKGEATFDDWMFDTPGTYVIIASGEGLEDSYQQTIEIKPIPTMTEILVPQYIKSKESWNAGRRMPMFAMIELDNLHPNTTYRFYTGGRQVGYGSWWDDFDIQEENGAGNNLHYDAENDTYAYSTNRDLNADDGFSTFITGDNQTIKRFWINIVPTANSSFTEGEDVYWLVTLGSEKGTQIRRYPTDKTSTAIDLGAAPENATGIVDLDSRIAPKRHLALYAETNRTMEDGVLRPVSTALVQDDGTDFIDPFDGTYTSTPFYEEIDWTEGGWATLIPNRQYDEEGTQLSSGLFRIDEYLYQNIADYWIDDDAVWNGVNTNDPGDYYYGLDKPIYFETPYVKLENPMEGQESPWCNTGFNMIEFDSRGVQYVDFEISTNFGSSWETIRRGVEANDGEEGWSIPRGVYNGGLNTLRIVASTYPNQTSETGEFRIFDAPVITQEARDLILCRGDDDMLSISASGNDLTYQWYKDDQPIPGATDPIYNIDDADYSTSGLYYCEVAGAGVCPSDFSEEYLVYVATNTKIVREPESQAIVEGGTAIFTVEAHVQGVPDDRYDVQYQWYNGDEPFVNDERVAGAQSDILSIVDLTAADATDQIWVKVIGLCGTEAESQRVGIVVPEITIARDPQGAELCEGEEVWFECDAVSAGGYGTMIYQWQKDGVDLVNDARISGANSSDLHIVGIAPADEGAYACVVTVGPVQATATSAEAQLDVKESARISSQSPITVEVDEGRSFLLDVTAIGDAPLEYQWYFDGDPIEDATSSSYSDADAQQEDAGTYAVKVWNECGEDMSEPFAVTVALLNLSGFEEEAVAGGFVLGTPEPNPVSGSANVFFACPSESFVRLSVVDEFGREVTVLFKGYSAAGVRQTTLDAAEIKAASGVYMLVLETPKGSITRKFVLVK